MSESTDTAQPDDEGTFVGGSFGDGTADETASETTDSTGNAEAARREPGTDVRDVFALGQVEETTDVEGTDEDGTDVEGTGTGVPPGGRNEPV